MHKKSVHILISGRVQGVGFRYFVLRKAEELQINGWVKNTPDGKVEIEAEGGEEQLSTFIDWMKIGPQRAVVSTMSVEEFLPQRNFSTFQVR